MRSPHLVTRLGLAFGVIAALPLMVVPFVIRQVTASYDATFARDLDDASRLVRNEINRLDRDVAERTRAVMRASLLPEIRHRLDEVDSAALVDLAGPALSASGLDVLEVVDKDGRILLSGHLPARMGDIDPTAKKLLARGSDAPVLAQVEVREGDDIRTRQALVVAFPAEQLGGIIGGKLFGPDEVSHLAELARADVTLGTTPVSADGPKGLVRRLRSLLFSQPARRGTDVPIATLDGDQLLRIHLSDAALMQTKWGIARGALAAFALALLAGVLLAAFLARRLVGPIQALVAGTKRLAEGDLQYRVEVKASGEIAQLVDAFNAMGGQLATARDRLAHAERVAAWEQIARALAHEIKNPLTPIAMAIETLQRTYERRHPEFDRFFKEGTATVLEEVSRLKRLATEFGEFARWPKPVVSPAAPSEIVRSAAALYGTMPPPHHLDVELDEGLPQVSVDRDQMQRALVNLIKNATEAMPAGGRIVLRARRDGGGIMIDVADNGPGMSREAREKLFEPYYTTKPEGTGLGLAIVHRIVTEHEGRVTVDETPGGGATFRIWLPVRRERT